MHLYIFVFHHFSVIIDYPCIVCNFDMCTCIYIYTHDISKII